MKKINVRVMQKPGTEDMPLPQYMTSLAAGMDLMAAVDEPLELAPGQIKLIPTGLHISLPEGFEAQIRPRSGLALKHGISMVNTPGTIDADYRGEIGIIMINFGSETFTVKRGDRIAQMVINEIIQAQFEACATLDETDRSSGGFGHTGK